MERNNFGNIICKKKITITMDSETIKKIDRLAERERRSRSSMIGVLCEVGYLLRIQGMKSIERFLDS